MYIVMIPPRMPPPRKSQFKRADIVAAALLLAFIFFAVSNILTNLEAAGAKPGFGFLSKEAGFDVSEALIPYSPSEPYFRVIIAGVLNTLWLSVVCILCSTIIGVLFGLLSVGPSPVGRWLARSYVDLFRNLPKILILLVLYVTAVNGLPHVRQALSLGPFHLSNRSINFPVPIWQISHIAVILSCLIGVVIWTCRSKFSNLVRPSCQPSTRVLFKLVAIATPVLVVWATGATLSFDVPVMKGFDFSGGGRVSLQFAVVATTLSIYHGAQIAEVVRGGLLAVPSGQFEASQALGLKSWQTIRLVILPQVMRIVIPPMNNQYVNLIKNTSIAIAVGYSDLMSVSGTIINQSFKPLEMMLITMAIYLTLCLSLTASVNRWHQHITKRESR